jgi:DNA-binding transcriptional MerR regulator
MTELLSLRDCARRLGVAPHRISYAHEIGALPDVRHRVAGKRIYTSADLKRLARYFKVHPQEGDKR